ncbi:Membrane protein involved in the export of O-antigen and teichoic acid [Hymenobacter daecheongensis DSM 21074]|uniref:Membrane protein involved in the export of O-antigen and teichoic acid n=1 Tax=Hymenobacter daecheongensis DSM 21074 TaxID=1121955 RepID=A0A1M6LDL3_9BACT|nr:polysaccharide biosynthesis C-terminal domain-containing protein [Hymenobacter daecheongensis]SHJ69266.1 Membrane protein involved in the export of O-antigen and teichoic acid [Hymenobacter daecheongensis DSM 21074]
MRKPNAATSSTLLGNSAYIFLIRFFPTLASVVALVWLSRHLAPAHYGQYQSFWVQWQVLHVVACLGLPTLVLTYPAALVSGLVRGIRRRQAAGLGVWLLVSAGGLMALQLLSGALFAPWQAGAFLLLGVPVAVLEAYALLGRQLRPLALLNIAYAGLFGAVHALLVAQVLSSSGLMSWLLVGNALRLAALAQLARQHYRRTAAPAPVALHTVRSLWFHTALNEVVQVLFRWVDKFVLNFLLPAALFALYFNGTLDVPFLPLLLGAAGSALLLHFAQADLPDTERLTTLKTAATLLGGLVFPVFFFLLFFRHELFAVVFAHRYDAAVPLFLISVLVLPLRAYNFTALLQHKGQGRTITRGAVLDLLLALVLMYPLYRLLGLVGVALAFVISTYCQAAYYLAHTARLLRVRWPELVPWRAWLGQLLGFGLGLLGLHAVLGRLFSPQAALLLAGSSVGAVVLLLLWVARRRR